MTFYDMSDMIILWCGIIYLSTYSFIYLFSHLALVLKKSWKIWSLFKEHMGVRQEYLSWYGLDGMIIYGNPLYTLQSTY